MPRTKSTDKFLRIDQNGKNIPEWKQKILERKQNKHWKPPGRNITYNEPKKFTRSKTVKKQLSKHIDNSNAKPDKTIKEQKEKPELSLVKRLINHYENIIKQN